MEKKLDKKARASLLEEACKKYVKDMKEGKLPLDSDDPFAPNYRALLRRHRQD